MRGQRETGDRDLTSLIGHTPAADRLMLTGLRCHGLKAFAEPTEISLRPITVVFGRNNSGKTTLVRLPLFIRESIANPELFAVASEEVSFASTFQDLASADQPHPQLAYGATWTPSHQLDIELQYVLSQTQPSRVQLTRLRVDDIEHTAELGDNSATLVPASRALTADAIDLLSDARRHLLEVLSSTYYLASDRPSIAPVYEMRPASSWTANETAHLLANNRPLLQAVDQWFLSSLDGTSIDVEVSASAFRLVTKSRQLGEPVNASRAGRGTQAALPLVTTLVAISEQRYHPALVLVEEPEAHLHASAHGDLADLAIESAAHSQLLIETHSENFILRLRRRIAEGVLSPEDLSLCFIDDDHRVANIAIDESGRTADWPHGVFEYDIEEAEAIVEAKLRASEGMG